MCGYKRRDAASTLGLVRRGAERGLGVPGGGFGWGWMVTGPAGWHRSWSEVGDRLLGGGRGKRKGDGPL